MYLSLWRENWREARRRFFSDFWIGNKRKRSTRSVTSIARLYVPFESVFVIVRLPLFGAEVDVCRVHTTVRPRIFFICERFWEIKKEKRKDVDHE